MSAKAAYAKPKRAFPQLPNELWITIFEHAGSTRHLLDIDNLLRVGRMKWKPTVFQQEVMVKKALNTKRSIICVSRQWNALGTPVLYETIVVGSNNVASLAAVLSRSQRKADDVYDVSMAFGWWTKHVYLAGDLKPLEAFLFQEVASRLPNVVILSLNLSCWHLYTRRMQSMYLSLVHTIVRSSNSLQLIDWPANAHTTTDFFKSNEQWLKDANSLRGFRLPTGGVFHASSRLSQVSTITSGLLSGKLDDYRCLPNLRHIIFDTFRTELLDPNQPFWSPWLRIAGSALRTLTIYLGSCYDLSELFIVVSESCPLFRTLTLSLVSWEHISHPNCFPPSMTTLELRCDQLQAKNRHYRHLVAMLEALDAENLRVVRFIDDRNWKDIYRHASIMRSITGLSRGKRWSIVDGMGRPMESSD